MPPSSYDLRRALGSVLRFSKVELAVHGAISRICR